MVVLAAAQGDHCTQCSGLLTFNLTLLVQLAIFVVTTALLWYILWRPVVRVIEARQRIIDAGAADAQEAERQLTRADEQVRQVLGRSRTEARAVIERAARQAREGAEAERARSRRQAEELVTTARADIAREREQAAHGLREHTRALVDAAARNILSGAAIDDAQLSRAVAEAVPQ